MKPTPIYYGLPKTQRTQLIKLLDEVAGIEPRNTKEANIRRKAALLLRKLKKTTEI